MTMVNGSNLLVHVTNMPTPYRVSFCNALHDALLDVGHELHALYCTAREPNRQWDVPNGNIAFPYTILPGVSPRVGPLYAHLNPSIVRWLRRLQPKFILIAGGWNIPTVMLASNRTLSGPGLRVFWSEGHAQAVLHPTGPLAWLRRYCLKAYDAFAVPNEGSACFLESELGFRPPSLPLPNTIDEVFYRGARNLDKLHLRRELGVPADVTLFVSVARLIDHKGVRELVQSMDILGTKDGRCMLVLVGDGPLKRELKETCRSGQAVVHVTGHQNAVQVRAWLAAADAFVLATKMDPNPLTLIEAAFAGLPLLVSHKAGNASDLVHDGVSGMVIPSIDPKTIASVLNRFCTLGSDERKQMGAGAANIAETGFQRKAVAERFVRVLLRSSGNL
jgi:glycosyltransferase involved in cell wall biosynthesis